MSDQEGVTTVYSLLGRGPEVKMKKRTIFYYHNDADAAMAAAIEERRHGNIGYTRDANTFYPVDAEECDVVMIMPDVPAHLHERIKLGYGEPRIKIRTKEEIATAQLIAGAERRDTESTAEIDIPTHVAIDADLSTMTRKELLAYAEKKGIHLDNNFRRRGEIIDAISRYCPGEPGR